MLAILKLRIGSVAFTGRVCVIWDRSWRRHQRNVIVSRDTLAELDALRQLSTLIQACALIWLQRCDPEMRTEYY